MESFGWDMAPAAPASELNFPPCFWSGRQREAGERSCRQPVAGGYGGGIAGGGDVDLAEAFLISSSGLRYGSVKTGEPTKLGGVGGMEMGVRLPPLLQPESMSSSSAAEVRQPQEAAPWPAAELSTVGTPWRDALTAFDHIGGHFGLTVDADAAEEDEVSAILSNCDTMPYRRSCSENVSSGESENDVCGTHGGDKGLHCRRPNVVGEVVSRASSNPDAIRPVISQLPRKRKEAERDESAAEEAGSLYRNVDLSSAGSPAVGGGGGGGGGFRIFFESSQSRSKKPARQPRASSIDFRSADDNGYEPDAEAIAQVKEMIYRAAAMRPVTLGPVEAAVGEKPKRKNVKISSDPQTVAARHRRERISERLRVLQRLVPGGSKMDTASMLDEAANYLKFLKSQVSALGAQGIAAGSAALAASYSPCSYLPPAPSSRSPFNPASTFRPLQNLHTQIQTLVQKRVLDRSTSTSFAHLI